MLEAQYCIVVDALATVYQQCINNEGFPGGPLEENGRPLTHCILERLGLIDMVENDPSRYGEMLARTFPENTYTAVDNQYGNVDHDMSEPSSRKSSGYDYVSSTSSESLSPSRNGHSDHVFPNATFLPSFAQTVEPSVLRHDQHRLEQVPNAVWSQLAGVCDGDNSDQFGFETPTNPLLGMSGPFDMASMGVLTSNFAPYTQPASDQGQYR